MNNEVADKTMHQSGYTRTKFDHYETEQWVTRVLLRYESFDKVWEPAVGKGAMAKVMQEYAIDVYGSDIEDYGCGYDVKDFLAGDGSEAKGRDIVTNAPYYGDMPDKFIERALELTKPHNGRVAMLFRNEFDCAYKRLKFFGQTPFATKIVLLRRPRWITFTSGSPRHNYAWYVWDWQWKKAPRIAYDR